MKFNDIEMRLLVNALEITMGVLKNDDKYVADMLELELLQRKLILEVKDIESEGN